jgi:uncharacterized membrane protein
MKIFLYCLKIWQSSVVVGTFLFYFVGNPTEDSSWTFWGYMWVVCLGATIYSLVSFLLFWAGVVFVTGRLFSVRKRKAVAAGWATILVIAPFPVLFGRNHPNWALLGELCGCYLAPLLVGIGVFRFPKVSTAILHSNP